MTSLSRKLINGAFPLRGIQSSSTTSGSTKKTGLNLSDYHTTGGVQSEQEDSCINNPGRPLASISEMIEVEEDNLEHR